MSYLAKILDSCPKSDILNGIDIGQPKLMFHIVKKEHINFHNLWISLFTVVGFFQYFLNITVRPQSKCLGEKCLSTDQSLLKDFLLVCHPLRQLTFKNYSWNIFLETLQKLRRLVYCILDLKWGSFCSVPISGIGIPVIVRNIGYVPPLPVFLLVLLFFFNCVFILCYWAIHTWQ